MKIFLITFLKKLKNIFFLLKVPPESGIILSLIITKRVFKETSKEYKDNKNRILLFFLKQTNGGWKIVESQETSSIQTGALEHSKN